MRIKCGACGLKHPTVLAVRDCSAEMQEIDRQQRDEIRAETAIERALEYNPQAADNLDRDAMLGWAM